MIIFCELFDYKYSDICCYVDYNWCCIVRNSIYSASMKPVFVGNFDYDTRQSDLERLFSKYGRLERVDMKSGKVVNSFLHFYFLWRSTCCVVVFV